jgi:chitinase
MGGRRTVIVFSKSTIDGGSVARATLRATSGRDGERRGGAPGFQAWAQLSSGGAGPKIFVGLPAAAAATGTGYVERSGLPAVVNSVRSNPAFGGIMLWDASFDQNSVEGGVTYGGYASSLL